MRDAYFGNVSPPTKTALLELSLEEAAKALTIVRILHSGKKHTEEDKLESTYEMVDSFQKHQVKVQVIKDLHERLISQVLPRFILPK